MSIRFNKMSSATVATGIAALLASQAGAAIVDLVTNGTFSTGNFSGWTQWGNPSYTSVSGGVAQFGPQSLGGIQQTLSTVVGATYTLTFDMQITGWDSTFVPTLGTLTATYNNVPPSGWQHHSFDYVASSSSTVLSFGFRNQADYFYIDNIAVTGLAAPAPGAMALVGAAGLFGSRRRRA